MKIQKLNKNRFAYDYIKSQIKANKSFKNLSNEDIEVIIFNQLRQVAEDRSWIKKIPISILQHY